MDLFTMAQILRTAQIQSDVRERLKDALFDLRFVRGFDAIQAVLEKYGFSLGKRVKPKLYSIIINGRPSERIFLKGDHSGVSLHIEQR